MADTSGSLARHAATAACLLMLGASVNAQTPDAQAPEPGFLTRYDFHLGADRLIIDDQRFSWDTHFGGSIDAIDYVVGRLSGIIEYEAILGDEFRAFDPNQSYYTLEVSSSYRIKATEIAGVFHHVSRHLSDRSKRFPIAWNVASARVLRQLATKTVTMDLQGEAGGIVERAYIDYSWTADLSVMVRRTLSPRVGLFAYGYGEFYGVDGSISDRGTQKGGRIEAGVRFNGSGGAIELFAGFENRIDADPTDLMSQRWGLAGFRLVGK
jgi:hypothetical protein